MEPITTTQAEAILKLEPIDVLKVYSGRANASGNHCRCGCRGNYRYNGNLPNVFVGSPIRGKDWTLDAEDINASKVKSTLRLLQESVRAGRLVTASDGWADVEIDGRSYTIYLVEGRSL